MKKIDKLILFSFVGPFILTFLVVVFILLLRHMLMYFDDIIGKDLGWDVVGTLLFYFAVFMTPLALPLAVLLSSLITFGNLSEHFEITAVKSLGISLTRSLVPIFLFVVLLTFFAFYVNNNWVPKAALEAYSLMYDIKQKKPALDLEEGAFYYGIPDISIKVDKKFSDSKTLKNVIIYDHRGRPGNKKVIMADSGKMYTILNDQYLKLELFDGHDYEEGLTDQSMGGGSQGTQETFQKTSFGRSEIVFDLSSFVLARTDKKWFQGNRIMRNVVELNHDMDSVTHEINGVRVATFRMEHGMFNYHHKGDTTQLPPELEAHFRNADSIARIANPSHIVPTLPFAMVGMDKIGGMTRKAADSIYRAKVTSDEISSALSHTRMMKTQLMNINAGYENFRREYKIFRGQWHKILSNSIACIVMFLIGAPLGAIIKKGGLGVPVIVSIFFFILFYIVGSTGEKWAEQDKIPVPVGIWAADVLLSVVGLLFLRQARVDARLFDSDFYQVVWDKVKKRLRPETPNTA